MVNKYIAALVPLVLLITTSHADVAPSSSTASSGIVDFYFSSPSSGATVPKVYIDVAKIQREIDGIKSYMPRMIATYGCFGTNGDICPVNVQKCDESIDTVDGYSVAVGATATDYTAKTGSSYSYAATASTTFGSDSCQGGSLQYFSASNYCSSKGMRLPTKAETVAGGGTVPSCSGYTWTSTYNYFSYSGVAYYWVWSGGGLTVRDAYDGDGNQASPSLVRCVGNVTTNTCPNGGTLSGSTCTVNTLACPTGYTATTGTETAKGECKKSVNYTYHNYLCPTTKITTNYASKTGSSYVYAATANYTACSMSTNGSPFITSCTTSKGGTCFFEDVGVTFSGTCVIIEINGYPGLAPINIGQSKSGYGFTMANTTSISYACSSGGILSGSTCTVNTLACPAGYVETTGAETANGACKTSTTVPLSFSYTPQDTGGDCNKTDPSVVLDNSSALAISCNSATPPTNNCIYSTMICPVEGKVCRSVPDSNDTYCSPIDCNSSNLCQIAQCTDEESANLGASDLSMCYNQICDTSKSYNGYCGKVSCPTGFGVYSDSGKCYQDVCPAGSIQQANGSCQQLKCPAGYTEVGDTCIMN